MPRLESECAVGRPTRRRQVTDKERELGAQEVDVGVGVIHRDALGQVAQRVLVLFERRVREGAVQIELAQRAVQADRLRKERLRLLVRAVLEEADGAQVEHAR